MGTFEETTCLDDPKHFKIKVDSTSATIRFALIEDVANCTTSDNPGHAYTDIYVRWGRTAAVYPEPVTSTPPP